MSWWVGPCRKSGHRIFSHSIRLQQAASLLPDASLIQRNEMESDQAKKVLTASRLKEVLHYDPKSGIFTRIPRTAQKKPNRVAGHITVSQSGKAYIRITVDGVRHYAHRLAFLYMQGFVPEQVDHDNGDGCDNRWRNLIASNPLKNARNQRQHSTNTSGVTGVSWLSTRKTWVASIYMDGRLVHLGQRKDFEAAVALRKAAENSRGYSPSHGKPRPIFGPGRGAARRAGVTA